MGFHPGEGLRNFADRFGLTDVRDLASVLLQSDRYGASIAKALRIYADTARQDRRQKAEEMAQQLAVDEFLRRLPISTLLHHFDPPLCPFMQDRERSGLRQIHEAGMTVVGLT